MIARLLYLLIPLGLALIAPAVLHHALASVAIGGAR